MMGALRSNIIGNVYDLDQKCCCHVIIAWLCKRNGIPCPLLDTYVARRDFFLEQVAKHEKCNKKYAKKIMIQIFMDDRKQRYKSHLVNDLCFEAHTIRRGLASLPQFKWVLDSIPERKNVLGSFLSRLYQQVEAKLTFAVSSKLSTLGVKTRCLMFDGMAVSKTRDVDEIIKIAEEESERLCPGLGMRWTSKPLDFNVYNDREEATGTLDLRSGSM